jgi:hypothetical protein
MNADVAESPAAAPAPRRAQRERVTLGALEDVIGLHIGLANGAVVQQFKKHLDHLKLTPKQTTVLWLVGDNPGAPQIDLARLIGVDRATMLAITNGLENRGLIERREIESDGRCLGLHLTAVGTSLSEAPRWRLASTRTGSRVISARASSSSSSA